MEKNKTLEKSRLGRGLSSLIPPSAKVAVAASSSRVETLPSVAETSVEAPQPQPEPSAPDLSEGVQQIAIDKIIANTYQPRSEFDQAALEELTASIQVHGVLQPVMVRPRGGGRYELIAGERRFRAARQAGLTQIPVVIRHMTDEESLTVALIENIQREDLNAMEAARGYKQLLDQFGLTQTELARQIGKSQSTIAYALSLLRLSPEMQDSISIGQITMEHGKVLLSIASSESRGELWSSMVTQGLSVAESRKRASQETSSPTRTVRAVAEDTEPDDDIHLKAIEDRLRSALGLKVSIRNGRTGRGVVTVDFSNMDELETIIDRIVG
ncbi:MAG: ParB/RepB/Spo0J family partition protein [Janthinobacterium lividum]